MHRSPSNLFTPTSNLATHVLSVWLSRGNWQPDSKSGDFQANYPSALLRNGAHLSGNKPLIPLGVRCRLTLIVS